MKKITILFFVVAAFAASLSAEAQNVKFSKYFTDATLRIDYHRVGCRQHDTIRIVAFEQVGQWAGSQTQLLDPFDNGEYRVVVREPEKGTELYSRCYNTLFREYRDTEKGKHQEAEFEEVVRLPWPKKPVEICFQKRDSLQVFYTQYVYYFDPASVQSKFQGRDGQKPSVSPVKLHYSGNIHKKNDIVIIPEGYGLADTAKMLEDLQKFCQYALQQEPFASRKSDFNVWGIPLTGESAGITNPGKGIHVNSLVGSSFNTFDIDRYLMTMHLFQVHDAIGQVPCDHIIIMCNTDTYGGGAIYNFYAMSSLNKMAYAVLPHELGHSIGGLADEYEDEGVSYSEMHAVKCEPPEPNITTLVDFGRKWKSMLPEGTPVPTPHDKYVYPGENGKLGVYEGGGYLSKGVYRPVMHCMMRDYAPFCPVCAQRLNDIFDLYTK